MADQKNRGGQKQGAEDPNQTDRRQGMTTGGAGQRSDPDDARRQPTDQQR